MYTLRYDLETTTGERALHISGTTLENGPITGLTRQTNINRISFILDHFRRELQLCRQTHPTEGT